MAYWRFIHKDLTYIKNVALLELLKVDSVNLANHIFRLVSHFPSASETLIRLLQSSGWHLLSNLLFVFNCFRESRISGLKGLA